LWHICIVVWLQAAQEKEELQRKGDQLDADIRKAEKETRALENTVRLLNSRNQTYHRSLARVGDTSKWTKNPLSFKADSSQIPVYVSSRPTHELMKQKVVEC